jgi:hypothetical protein
MGIWFPLDPSVPEDFEEVIDAPIADIRPGAGDQQTDDQLRPVTERARQRLSALGGSDQLATRVRLGDQFRKGDLDDLFVLVLPHSLTSGISTGQRLLPPTRR